ncbi:MAG: ribonuclease H-like domain-containing protein [Bacteroidia bacterium]|jgi:predicted PolB exonuclease-like 3'-5' exonuclease|nr:ribonuclease H-like domain-containing protein [Bacteroidia bacterium]
MLANVKPEDILFLDIETVPTASSYTMLDQSFQAHWEKKSRQFRDAVQSAEEVYERAGIYAEFGKIICISVGLIKEKTPFSFRIKSFYGDDEKTLLSEFSAMLNKFSKNREALLCAHNGKEFDYPYIARRMIINSMIIPDILDNAGKKPWEVKLLDTLDLWKFGDYKSYTSLDLLTTTLNIPSPKDDIDGSMVAGIYHNEHDIKRIAKYCEKDVLAVAQVLLRFMNLPKIEEEKIESVTQF